MPSKSQAPNEVVLVTGFRTPFAKSGSKMKDIKAVRLGTGPTREILQTTGLDPSQVDEVIFGNTGSPEDAANISRVIALESGLPNSTPAYTVHRNCASGMEAVHQAYLKIAMGESDIIIAGGVESMTNMPLLFGKEMKGLFMNLMTAKTPGAKLQALTQFRPQHLKPIVAIQEGLTDPFCGLNMGETAEVLAREFQITREDQDAYAIESHNKVIAHRENLAEEIAPISTGSYKGDILTEDFGAREGLTMEKMAKLKPYFDRRHGTVTVGNACPITDGGVALLITSRKKADELGLKPIARIQGAAFAGLEPNRMGLGPVYATSKICNQLNLELSDFDLVEINEAFAAQVIACIKAMASEDFCRERLGRDKALGQLPMEKLNVNGGAIALGHPVGATGARLVLTLAREMNRRGAKRGLASLCIGGGQGGAVVLESLS